jgi:LGFP repeat
MLYPEDVVGQFVPANAIPAYFVQHPEIGSPIGGEADWDGVDGGRIQSFTGGVVGWDAANGARVVSE